MQIDDGMGLSSLVVSCIVPVSGFSTSCGWFVLLLGFSCEIARPNRLTFSYRTYKYMYVRFGERPPQSKQEPTQLET